MPVDTEGDGRIGDTGEGELVSHMGEGLVETAESVDDYIDDRDTWDPIWAALHWLAETLGPNVPRDPGAPAEDGDEDDDEDDDSDDELQMLQGSVVGAADALRDYVTTIELGVPVSIADGVTLTLIYADPNDSRSPSAVWKIRKKGVPVGRLGVRAFGDRILGKRG